MKVYFLIPFLFLVIACQSTTKKAPKARIPEKLFDYFKVEKDYEEILEAILTYNSYIIGTIKSKEPRTYIESIFTKDSIYTCVLGGSSEKDDFGFTIIK